MFLNSVWLPYKNCERRTQEYTRELEASGSWIGYNFEVPLVMKTVWILDLKIKRPAFTQLHIHEEGNHKSKFWKLPKLTCNDYCFCFFSMNVCWVRIKSLPLIGRLYYNQFLQTQLVKNIDNSTNQNMKYVINYY